MICQPFHGWLVLLYMKINNTYSTPNTGCLIGTAYQVLISQLNEKLRNAGLDISAPEYLILRTLYVNDGIQPCNIADALGKDKATISRTITSMVKKTLVYTESTSHKCLKVYLSDYGREIKPIIMSIATERHLALGRILSQKEINDLTQILIKIIQQQ